MKAKGIQKFNTDREEVIDNIFNHYKSIGNHKMTREVIEDIIIDYESIFNNKMQNSTREKCKFFVPGIGSIYNRTQHFKAKARHNDNKFTKRIAYEMFMEQKLFDVFVGLLK